ncbi:MAG: hypothetical protein ACYC6L_03590 [Anaerolineae bacterium]
MPINAAMLELYARQCIGAEHYPEDVHTFEVFTCDHCGAAPFEITIAQYTGSETWDFKGIIYGRCSVCGRSTTLFGVTGEHRQHERDEYPTCACGSRRLYTAMCERYEGPEGLEGFFDEGVVVGQCAVCGLNLTLVNTD